MYPRDLDNLRKYPSKKGAFHDILGTIRLLFLNKIHHSTVVSTQILQMANYTGVIPEKKIFIPKAKIFFWLSDPRDLAKVGSDTFLMTVPPHDAN